MKETSWFTEYCTVLILLTSSNVYHWVAHAYNKGPLIPTCMSLSAKYIFTSPCCCCLQEYPGDELLLVYDPDYKYGENFYICLTEEAKELILNVSTVCA